VGGALKFGEVERALPERRPQGYGSCAKSRKKGCRRNGANRMGIFRCRGWGQAHGRNTWMHTPDKLKEESERGVETERRAISLSKGLSEDILPSSGRFILEKSRECLILKKKSAGRSRGGRELMDEFS